MLRSLVRALETCLWWCRTAAPACAGAGVGGGKRHGFSAHFTPAQAHGKGFILVTGFSTVLCLPADAPQSPSDLVIRGLCGMEPAGQHMIRITALHGHSNRSHVHRGSQQPAAVPYAAASHPLRGTGALPHPPPADDRKPRPPPLAAVTLAARPVRGGAHAACSRPVVARPGESAPRHCTQRSDCL